MGVGTKRAMDGAENLKVGIELPAELHQRLKVEAARRNIKMKDVYREALEIWLTPNGEEDGEEFRRQMTVAREGMSKYKNALRELAR